MTDNEYTRRQKNRILRIKRFLKERDNNNIAPDHKKSIYYSDQIRNELDNIIKEIGENQ